jgi:virulence-associated protein VapD
MSQYAIAFDLDTNAMRAAGLTDSQRTDVYQKEIPNALSACGFTAHLQGSLYATEVVGDPIVAIMQLKTVLRQRAPGFCKFVNRVHVFRMEDWSDVTAILRTEAVPAKPMGDSAWDGQAHARR